MEMLFRVIAEMAKEYEERQKLNATLRFSSDEFGNGVTVDFHSSVPKDAQVQAHIVSMWGTALKTPIAEFANQDGHFVAVGHVAEQQCRLYIPYGALVYKKADIFDLHVEVGWLEGSKLRSLGKKQERIALPSPRPWHRVEYLWPLIGLCMAVVRADEVVAPAEVRSVKDFMVQNFKLEAKDMDALRLAMKTARTSPLNELVALTKTRIPHLLTKNFVRFLFELAYADGSVHPREQRVIKDIAQHLGLSDHDWQALVAEGRGTWAPN